MKTDNLIELKSWKIDKDNCGSDYKIISNNKIISVELKKAQKKNENDILFSNLKIYLNQYFDEKNFVIPKCKGFQITYKTNGNNSLFLGIEENMNIYNFHYLLPPSKEWSTKVIKINDPEWIFTKNTTLNLNKITGFIFFFKYFGGKEVIDTLYIKEFIIKGYEVYSIKNNSNFIYKKILLRKSILNNIKLFFQKKKEKKYNKFKNGESLYCIYPFYQFVINHVFYSTCCWIGLEENHNIINNNKLLNVWYGEKFDKMRECIKNLSYSECNLKDCMQLGNSIENFKTLDEIRSEYPKIADFIEDKTNKYRELPTYISAGFDNTCNLSCKSCTADKLKNQPREKSQIYIQEIEKIGNEVEILLISSYGDPFATPSYRDWLYNFQAEKFPKLKKIEILSNAILWTKENWNKVSKDIKKYNIEGTISIDGATRETYEYNRGGAKFNKLLGNLGFISNLRMRNEINSLLLYFVVQKNNYKEIPLMIDFAKKYNFDSIFFKQISNWGSYTEEEFNKVNIFNKNHPDHKNFIEICKKVDISKIEDIDVKFIFKI